MANFSKTGLATGLAHFRALNGRQRHAFFACLLGWSLDAFDFFILVFCVSAIAKDFHAAVPAVAKAIFWTLACRPVGALVFGAMADRFGRRPTLMLNIACFSVLELACAFAPSLHVLLILRALFGVAMGGEWGVGAALALESLPKEGRGFFSNLAGRLRARLSAGRDRLRRALPLRRMAGHVPGGRGAGGAGRLYRPSRRGVSGLERGPGAAG